MWTWLNEEPTHEKYTPSGRITCGKSEFFGITESRTYWGAFSYKTRATLLYPFGIIHILSNPYLRLVIRQIFFHF